MSTTSSLTTHICTLSFCKLLLEVDGDTIHIQFMNLPDGLLPKDLLPLLTPSDAINLIHFVFHHERLGSDFASLFFEWKDTVELQAAYKKATHLVPQDDQRLHTKLLQQLNIILIRYLKIIGSHCDTTQYDLIAFIELLEEALTRHDLP